MTSTPLQQCEKPRWVNLPLLEQPRHQADDIQLGQAVTHIESRIVSVDQPSNLRTARKPIRAVAPEPPSHRRIVRRSAATYMRRGPHGDHSVGTAGHRWHDAVDAMQDQRVPAPDR
ncbi:hypothetical protein GCM10009702_03290 [Propioniferax innocua]